MHAICHDVAATMGALVLWDSAGESKHHLLFRGRCGAMVGAVWSRGRLHTATVCCWCSNKAQLHWFCLASRTLTYCVPSGRLADAFYPKRLTKGPYTCSRTPTAESTTQGRQPARQDESGGGVLLWDTSTLQVDPIYLLSQARPEGRYKVRHHALHNQNKKRVPDQM